MRFFILLFLFLNFINADEKPILLGNPYTKEYKSGEEIYARNIWDMQLFNKQIYLGAGNSSNKGPAQNAGRVYVVSLDPKTDEFTYEYKVAEEQIDLFKVYDDVLYIPGHDATQKWTLGNIYSKQQGRWHKHRTLPKALHVYDLVVKDNKIFTAIGLYKKGAVFISDKKAQSWNQVPHGDGRVYSFLEVGDKLFATKTFKANKPKKLNMTQWLEEHNTFSARFDLNVYKMFPDTKLKNYSIKIIKPTKDDKSSFYIGTYKHNDHQNEPFGLYKAVLQNKKLQVKRILLESGYIPRDILSREEKVYILSTKEGISQTTNKLFEIDKNDKLKEVLSFKYNSFARSFEELEGCFYFGIGSEVKSSKNWEISELKKESGDILKVCKGLNN